MGVGFPVIRGVGIHTGREFELTASQRVGNASEKQGALFFCQNDSVSRSYLEAPAHVSRISGTSRSTALVVRGSGRIKGELKTIEHLMAAYHVAGFPNLNFFIRDLSSAKIPNEEKIYEVPILQGSAMGFESFFENVSLSPSLEAYVIKQSFVFEHEGKSVRFDPSETQAMTSQYKVDVEFSGNLKQSCSWEICWDNPADGQKSFWNEISRARTFGFSHELDSLRSRGLGLGGSLDNAILIDGDKVVNAEGFLIENELAAHKLLDALGDFALLGGPLLGRISCYKAGHAIHLRALTEAFKADVFQKVTLNPGLGLFKSASI